MAISITGSFPGLNVNRPPYPTQYTFTPFSLSSPSGGVAPYTYFLSGGTLPKGIHLHPVTGDLIGSTGEIGQFTYKYRVYDSTNDISNEATRVITINDTVPPVIPAIGPKIYTQGQYISEEFVMGTDWEAFDTYSVQINAGIDLPLVLRRDFSGVKKWYFEGQVTTTTGGNTVNNSYTVTDAAGLSSNVNFNLTINDLPDGGWVGKIDAIRDDEFDIVLTKTNPDLNNRDLDIIINMLQK